MRSLAPAVPDRAFPVPRAAPGASRLRRLSCAAAWLLAWACFGLGSGCNGSNGDRPREAGSAGGSPENLASGVANEGAAKPAMAAVGTPGAATPDAGSPTDAEKNAASSTPPTDDAAESFLTTSTGLRYRDLTVGSGDPPRRGQAVTIRYSMWRDDGRQLEAGTELAFAVGAGRVVRGLDEAVATMRAGGKRKLVLSPALGYGQNGRPADDIPPNATLTLEVELIGLSAK